MRTEINNVSFAFVSDRVQYFYNCHHLPTEEKDSKKDPKILLGFCAFPYIQKRTGELHERTSAACFPFIKRTSRAQTSKSQSDNAMRKIKGISSADAVKQIQYKISNEPTQNCHLSKHGRFVVAEVEAESPQYYAADREQGVDPSSEMVWVGFILEICVDVNCGPEC